MYHPPYSRGLAAAPDDKKQLRVLAIAIALAVGGYVVLRVTQPWEDEVRAEKRARAKRRKQRA